MYANGIGIEKDPAKAAQWFETAAANGSLAANTEAGILYSRGSGMKKDGAKAEKYLSKAANAGIPNAQMTLGVLLTQGDLIQKNYVEAYKWFNLAAASGMTNAISNREYVKQHMTKEEISKGQALAAEFKPKQ